MLQSALKHFRLHVFAVCGQLGSRPLPCPGSGQIVDTTCKMPKLEPYLAFEAKAHPKSDKRKVSKMAKVTSKAKVTPQYLLFSFTVFFEAVEIYNCVLKIYLEVNKLGMVLVTCSHQLNWLPSAGEKTTTPPFVK